MAVFGKHCPRSTGPVMDPPLDVLSSGPFFLEQLVCPVPSGAEANKPSSSSENPLDQGWQTLATPVGLSSGPSSLVVSRVRARFTCLKLYLVARSLQWKLIELLSRGTDHSSSFGLACLF